MGKQREKLRQVELSKILRSPNTSRSSMDIESLNQLAESIAANGLGQPIILRERDGTFELVAGHRRVLAARQLGWDVIPAMVLELDDESSSIMALVENLQRENPSPIETAQLIDHILSTYDCTQTELAAKLGCTQSFIAHSLRLLRLPECLQRMLNNRLISAGHAKILVGVESELAVTLAQACIREKWSVRQLEIESAKPRREVATLEGIASVPMPSRSKSVDVKHLSTPLIGKGVRIRKFRQGNGRMTIEFDTQEQLNNLLTALECISRPATFKATKSDQTQFRGSAARTWS